MKTLFAILSISLFVLSCTPQEPQLTGRTITLELQVPDAGWSLEIEKVSTIADRVIVLANLQRAEGMAAQMITTVTDTITVSAPEGFTEEIYIIGKTWDWENEEKYKFIQSRDEIEPVMDKGTILFEKG